MTNSYFPSIKAVEQAIKYGLDEGDCLEIIFKERYGESGICPNCKQKTKFYRIQRNHAWSCGKCKSHISPRAGTLFNKSATPLRLWFQAIELVVVSSGIVPSYVIQAKIGVTYKTAWRMRSLICKSLGYEIKRRPRDSASLVQVYHSQLWHDEYHR